MKIKNVIAESERVRRTIPFETVQYGETFTNETFDVYGIDLPKGIKLLLVCISFGLVFILIFYFNAYLN